MSRKFEQAVEADELAELMGGDVSANIAGEGGLADPRTVWQPPVGFESMETADRSGRAVMLARDENIAVEGYWRRSRVYDAKAFKWKDVEFWAVRNAVGRRLDFEPVGWKALQ